MALLFFDGFDHYGSGVNPVTVGKWGTESGGPSIQTTQTRTGTGSMKAGGFGGGNVTTKVLPASGACVLGFAHYISSGAPSAYDVARVQEGSTVHVALAITTGGLLQVKRGTTVLATGTTVIPIASWVYLELRAVIHDTTGAYEVRVDGVVEAALTATGVDTREAAGATGQWDRVTLQQVHASALAYIDDFYVCDTSGAAPRNTFLGPVKVETLLPQTDAVAVGSNAGLTPSTSTDHGALVDEVPANTTDYNSSPTVGLKDTYNVPSPALTGAVLGVQTALYVSKSDATARTVCAVVRAGGVDYDGAAVAPSTTFAYVTELRAQNPNTVADWLIADLATVQVGMKVVS